MIYSFEVYMLQISLMGLKMCDGREKYLRRDLEGRVTDKWLQKIRAS